MKQFKSGLVLGKFMPLQNGHIHLIESAAKQCDILHVMICSDDTQPIDGWRRYQWLRKIFEDRGDIEIIWCQDENPQYPNEANSVDEFYKKYWVPSVYSLIEYLDVVFTSESYGDEFAMYLGIQHVLIDQPRETYAISATSIRQNPFYNWQYIPDVVKPYFKKTIAIMGSESTGKSTLTKQLAEYFKVQYIEEYGREYTERTGTQNLTTKDFVNIGTEHLGRVLSLQQNSKDKLLFLDTEAITTALFHQLYLGTRSELVDRLIQAQRIDFFIVLDIDVPWVDDGSRDFPNKRQEHLNMILDELETRNLPFVLVSAGGDYEKRFRKAKEEVERLGYLLENPSVSDEKSNQKAVT